MNKAIKTRIEEINSGKVPNGYKKTKIGIFPVEWEEKNLSAILARQTTKNRGNSIHNVLTNSATQGIISQQDYFDKQIANNENTDGYYIVENGYFVYNPRISVSAPCGPFNKYYGEDDGIMSPLYTVYKYVDNSAAYSDFLAYLFYSTIWHGYMHSIANYGARSDRMSVANEDIDNMPLPYPPVKEQQKIAEILKTQDRNIEIKEKLLEQKKLQKKYLMQKLLTGEIRSKGFKEKWEIKKIHELVSTITTGKLDANAMEKDGQYRFYTCAENYYYINTYAFDEEALLISGNGANVGYIHYYKGKFNAYQRTYVLYGFNCNILFLKYYLNMFLSNRIDVEKNSGNTPYIKLKTISDMLITIPTEEEQKAIVDILSTKEQEIELLQKELEQEKQKKKALMQLLLSGIVRV